MNARTSRHSVGLGFSLVELLAVMSLIVILTALTAPAVTSFLGARGMTRAISEIVSLVETARNEAMTTQSLVWLCLEQGVDDEGNEELRAVILAPIDSTPTTVSQAGKVAISSTGAESPVFRWRGLKLVALSALPEILALAPPETVSEALAAQRPQPFRSGVTKTSVINYQTIAFTPQGYAMLTAVPKITTPYVKMIDLGLQRTRGGGGTDRPNCAGLLLNGFNGQIQVLRR
jgi:type II secretory pathway pseudopilin PulG